MCNWFMNIFKINNKTNRENKSLKSLLNSLSSLDNFTNVLSKNCYDVSTYSTTTHYSFDNKCKYSIGEIMTLIPFKPYSTYNTGNGYYSITVSNRDLDMYYNNKNLKRYLNTLEGISQKYNSLNEEDELEFIETFEESLNKVLKFMKTITLNEFKGENFELIMDILNSILEHQGKVDLIKTEELRKELQIEVEYLKRIKENPLYF